MSVELVELDACSSTQDEVRQRLAGRAAGTVLAVSAGSQHAGRGREGRTWHDPPGEALLVSVGVVGPVPAAVLASLPRRVADVVLAAAGADGPIAWKEPNDLVEAATGAKVAGILIDARTVGASVESIVVGIGCNVTGRAFTTPDGRAATSLSGVLGVPVDRSTLQHAIVERIAALLR